MGTLRDVKKNKTYNIKEKIKKHSNTKNKKLIWNQTLQDSKHFPLKFLKNCVLNDVKHD